MWHLSDSVHLISFSSQNNLGGKNYYPYFVDEQETKAERAKLTFVIKVQARLIIVDYQVKFLFVVLWSFYLKTYKTSLYF